MATPLWTPTPERIAGARITEFARRAAERAGRALPDYDALWEWSVEDREGFWQAMWEYGEIVASRPADEVLVDDRMPGARWFVGARLNFAENLLRYRDDRPALVSRDERGRRRVVTYAELADATARMAAWLRSVGVGPGDRVAGFVPNVPEPVVAMLAATSIGAIWSSCSPDFGIRGVVDRFGQIEPRVLFTADGYSYAGKTHDSLGRIADILPELPSIEHVVVFPNADEEPDLGPIGDRAVAWADCVARPAELSFEPLPFDHPVYILYSSGTTGVPKCIVHGAGGTLLQHLKEQRLHLDLRREDRIFYFTTCGWMMWNWLVSTLGTGSSAVLYDGSPFHPDPEGLWRMAGEERLSHFGTSAKYLAAIEKEGLEPGSIADLGALRTLMSTGSPLSVEGFHYVYRAIKQDLNLASISGGTDLIACFVCGNPTLPVYAPEVQCRALGMAVAAFDEAGAPVVGRKGELVCTKAFPSMPVRFWNDPGDEKYRAAYFDFYPGIWRHGDYVELTERGGMIIYGRSDANPEPGWRPHRDGRDLPDRRGPGRGPGQPGDRSAVGGRRPGRPLREARGRGRLRRRPGRSPPPGHPRGGHPPSRARGDPPGGRHPVHDLGQEGGAGRAPGGARRAGREPGCPGQPRGPRPLPGPRRTRCAGQLSTPSRTTKSAISSTPVPSRRFENT